MNQTSDPKIWNPSKRDPIKIKEMLNGHLVNTVNYLHRNAHQKRKPLDDRDLRTVLENTYPQYKNLIKEINRRQFTVEPLSDNSQDPRTRVSTLPKRTY